MIECERLLDELDEKGVEWRRASGPARAPGATQEQKDELAKLVREFCGLRDQAAQEVETAGTTAHKKRFAQLRYPRVVAPAKER